MNPHAPLAYLSQRQRNLLEKWVRNKADTPHRLIERAHIILMSAEGISNLEQGRRLRVNPQRIYRWRTRWIAAHKHLADAEAEAIKDKDLAVLMAHILDDGYRSGTPPIFTAEQLTQIIAVACEPPVDSNRPVTHWSPRELADEVKKRGIVETISPRHVDRLLKGGISVRTRAGTG